MFCVTLNVLCYTVAYSCVSHRLDAIHDPCLIDVKMMGDRAEFREHPPCAAPAFVYFAVVSILLQKSHAATAWLNAYFRDEPNFQVARVGSETARLRESGFGPNPWSEQCCKRSPFSVMLLRFRTRQNENSTYHHCTRSTDAIYIWHHSFG
jgi:hypothetical protein